MPGGKDNRLPAGTILLFIIGFESVISVFVFLLILALYSKYDMTFPFIIAIAVSGLLILYLFTEIRKNRYQASLADKKINKAINLMNRVKIKYINNTALSDYLYSKYSKSA